ncbi:asparaginase [Hoyosella subflava]|uniref:L-asparaginase n=1 Tax=Hoyosella subflava (strain DSM 45089 / JCM 17490 / NBRC 109087 / DQS3-9A1) TaxID=443218 RepID=F6EKI5_HOYSD|nr:asparaginase [Hoyosella subflava]AEF39156.1 L-asparaginase [Hoyosella subflava DQS3-9A1]
MHYVPLVEVVRSGFVEGVHHGALVILTPAGQVLHLRGSIDAPIYPRSTNKPLQAVGLLRAGYKPADDEHMALATASHEGEPDHVAIVTGMLDGIGAAEEMLQCPPDLPLNEAARARVIHRGEGPRKIYMNCSGKHAAMLAACIERDWPTESYMDPAHPLQVQLAATVREIAEEPEHPFGVDGCGLPIIPVTLTGLARAFQKLATATGGTFEHQVTSAISTHPYLMSGTGKPDVILMRTVPGLICKSGADGVFAGGLPDGTAFAFKFADGHERPRLPLAAAVLRALDAPGADKLPATPVLGGGQQVGEVRAATDAVSI